MEFSPYRASDYVTRADIEEALAEFYEPEGVRQWLETPHPQLGGQRPLDLIEAGEVSPVLTLLEADQWLLGVTPRS